jgi:hypothetical protein
MNIGYSRSRLLGVLGVSALAVACALHARQVRRQQVQPFGRLTAREVLDRTAPLCRAIAPGAQALHLTAEPVQELGHRWWYITGKDAAGREVANCIWNADTAELDQVGGGVGSIPPGKLAPMGRLQAQQRAWNWLRALGIAQGGGRWRLVGPALLAHADTCDTWNMQWQGEGRRVWIELEAHYGHLRLISADAGRRSRLNSASLGSR